MVRKHLQSDPSPDQAQHGRYSSRGELVTNFLNSKFSPETYMKVCAQVSARFCLSGRIHEDGRPFDIASSLLLHPHLHVYCASAFSDKCLNCRKLMCSTSPLFVTAPL
jgi:hypothetical protein